jgi:putative hydroxymethylpyrimidine transport system ATP-binding protein
MLELRDLSKSFARRPAFERLSLAMGAHEIVSLVGTSGCGKSTLLRIVAGLEPPSEGEVLVDGRSVVGRPGAAAYMPQRDLLLPWLSVLDNAALPLELAGRPREEARREADAIFARNGDARPWENQPVGTPEDVAAFKSSRST